MKIYNTRFQPVEEVEIDPQELRETLNRAIYRFWLAERRLPAAIVMATQLARQFMDTYGEVIALDLWLFGPYTVSSHEAIPVVGREAYIDPLFILI